jgi:hypothetical protein
MKSVFFIPISLISKIKITIKSETNAERELIIKRPRMDITDNKIEKTFFFFMKSLIEKMSEMPKKSER